MRKSIMGRVATLLILLLSAAPQAQAQTGDPDKSAAPQAQAVAPGGVPQQAPTLIDVPSGAIIAWIPRAGDITQVKGESKIVPPKGWLLCDGSRGTPDLRSRGLMGTLVIGEIKAQVGSEQHTHTVSGTTDYGNGHKPYIPGKQFQAEGGKTYVQNYNFNTVSGPSSNVPPSVKVVFIMKE